MENLFYSVNEGILFCIMGHYTKYIDNSAEEEFVSELGLPQHYAEMGYVKSFVVNDLLREEIRNYEEREKPLFVFDNAVYSLADDFFNFDLNDVDKDDLAPSLEYEDMVVCWIKTDDITEDATKIQSSMMYRVHH